MPRFDLIGGPSPLVAAPRFSAALGDRAEVWIKREDLLPLAFGGNKLRNLEFLVGEALARGADTLVTSGRRWSNHCRLTAAAGPRAGLGVHLVLTGPPVSPPGANERLDVLLGAHVHVAATDARTDREALVARVARELIAGGHRPYVIGLGGTSSSEGDAVGAVGQVLAGLEMAAQAKARRRHAGPVRVAGAGRRLTGPATDRLASGGSSGAPRGTGSDRSSGGPPRSRHGRRRRTGARSSRG
jgi:D-cysteine desulfhydrase